MIEYPLPDDMHIREDYRVFPLEWEEDPLIVFHGTAISNFDAIRAEGLKWGSKAGGSLESVSYAKGSSAALTHWVGRREGGEAGVLLAFRFGSFEGLHEEGQIVYDYKPVPSRPEIIGYVPVPGTYVHR